MYVNYNNSRATKKKNMHEVEIWHFIKLVLFTHHRSTLIFWPLFLGYVITQDASLGFHMLTFRLSQQVAIYVTNKYKSGWRF